jgi:nucleoside-diphosphate-sugar epimerase
MLRSLITTRRHHGTKPDTSRRASCRAAELARQIDVPVNRVTGIINGQRSKFLNVGTGQDITIAEFARVVADVVGYRGRFVFDTSRPDGPPQKLLNVSELTRLGWRAKTPLREGIAAAYSDFLANGGRRSRVRLREGANTSA